MDDIQKMLLKMMEDHPSCINERKQLKALLSDSIPQNKMQQKLILNAYDEDIIDRFQASSDVTLHALQMVKHLMEEYGITTDAATWAVVTWCYMLDFSEIADGIVMVSSAGNQQQSGQQKTGANNGGYRDNVGFGRYAVGYEIPEGIISFRTDGKVEEGDFFSLKVINNEKSEVYLSFTDTVTAEVKKGQFVEIVHWGSGFNYNKYKFSIQKLD